MTNKLEFNPFTGTLDLVTDTSNLQTSGNYQASGNYQMSGAYQISGPIWTGSVYGVISGATIDYAGSYLGGTGSLSGLLSAKNIQTGSLYVSDHITAGYYVATLGSYGGILYIDTNKIANFDINNLNYNDSTKSLTIGGSIFSSGLNVKGNITTTGSVDGIDISAYLDQPVKTSSTPTFAGLTSAGNVFVGSYSQIYNNGYMINLGGGFVAKTNNFNGYSAASLTSSYGLELGNGVSAPDIYLKRTAANTATLSNDASTGVANLIVNGKIGIGTSDVSGGQLSMYSLVANHNNPIQYYSTTVEQNILNGYYTPGTSPTTRVLDIVARGNNLNGADGDTMIRFLTNSLSQYAPSVEQMRVTGTGDVIVGTGNVSNTGNQRLDVRGGLSVGASEEEIPQADGWVAPGAGFTDREGEKFIVRTDGAVLTQIKTHTGCTATKAYLLDASQNILVGPVTITGNVAAFNYTLTKGTTYFAAIDSAGAGYDRNYAPIFGDNAYPISKSYVTFTNSLSGGTEYSGYVLGVHSITVQGGNVGIGIASPTSPLQVVGLSIYTNNAMAVASGLSAGAFYRNGADPDVVCVVH